MKLSTALVVALSFLPSVANAEGTRLYMHYIPHSTDLMGGLPNGWRTVINNPADCGVEIQVPWSFVDKDGVYDWSSLDQFVAVWASQSKLTTLDFSAAASNIAQQMGPTLYNTPAYVLASGAPVLQCHQEKGGGEPSPPTPDFLDSRVLGPWQNFIRAAVAHYGSDPKIAYLRFAIGGDESYPEASYALDPGCLPQMEAAGINAQTWLTHGLASVDFVASLNPGVQIVWALNTLDALETSSGAFAATVGNEAKRLHELSGNDGFPINNMTFIYTLEAPYTYAQSASLGNTGYAAFPPNAAELVKLGVHTFEMRANIWSAAFNPADRAYPKWHAAYQAAFNSLGPVSGPACRLGPGQF